MNEWISRGMLYALLAIVFAVTYDYCYKNAKLHPTRSAVIGAVAAFAITFIGAGVLDGNFTISRAWFGLLAGGVLGVSFFVIGKRQQQKN
jgi:hypothetical protein